MNKVKSVMRKLIRVIIWIALSFVLLILAIAALVQIPTIQTKIVQYATSFISNKTHTKVELKKLSISFPKTVVIEGLYLEDTHSDTLIYAQKAVVNIALIDLISNKITVNSFSLNDAVLNFCSTKTNPEFNYEFLTTAFADTSIQAPIDTLSSSKWVFNLDKVNLQKFRFKYNDYYAGMNVFVSIENSNLSVDVLDLGKLNFVLDKVLIEGMNAQIGQVETTNLSAKNPDNVLPTISAKTLNISNSIVSYIDSVGKILVHADLQRCKLKEADIELDAELIKSKEIFLSESKIRFHNFIDILAADSLRVNSDSLTGNNWQITIDKLLFENSAFNYKVGNKPALKNEFDAENLDFTQMNLKASDFYYASELTNISVKKFSAINHNSFIISNMETDFSMDEHAIATKNLKLTTPFSSFDADFKIQYTSLDEFTTGLQFTNLDLNMRNVTFKSHDVLYFSPSLIAQPFFKNSTNSTTIKGEINGPLNNLTGKQLTIKTGESTSLETDFDIKGMPDIETATFHFPDLKIHSSQKDMVMMAGSSIPETIELPNNILIQLAFKGKLKSFETTATMHSSFGGVNLTAVVDSAENFNAKVSLSKLDLGQLLKDTLFYGPVSLTAEAVGKGLDLETITAQIKAEASQIYLNQYNYQNLALNGTITGKQFEGNIKLNDENAVFDFDGLVNLNQGQEQYKFRLNMEGIDLQKLHFNDSDVRMAFVADADFKGSDLDNLNGTATVNNITVVSNNKTYQLDSFNIASVNETNRSEFNISSPLIDMKYSGTVSPSVLPAVLNQFINNYFPISDSLPQLSTSEKATFNFEMQLHNHPLLSKVLLPGLNEFVPEIITGSFDSEKNDFKLNATINKIVYGTTEMNDIVLNAYSDNTALNFKITGANITNSQLGLDNLIIEGVMADNTITNSISSIDNKQYKKLLIKSKISKQQSNYKLMIDPANFYLMNKRWDIMADNYIELSKDGFLIHNLFLNHAQSQLNIESVNNKFNDDLSIVLRNFKLSDLLGVIAKDTSLVSGTTDGNILMKRVNDSYGMIADVSVKDLSIRAIPIGALTLQVENAKSDQFNIDLNLSGADNKLQANGYFIPNGGAKAINIKAAIESLSMKTIEAFSMGQISEASGMLTGDFLVNGSTDSPDITGQLVFTDAFMKPALLNNRIELKHETIQLKTDGLYFKNFTLSDTKKNTAVIDGAVKMNKFSDFNFAFTVTAKDFLLLNTTKKDSKDFFGQLIIDSKINVSGPMTLPVVKAQLKMKKGSNFTFIVPEEHLTTDKGEDVVEFESKVNLNSILYRGYSNTTNKSNLSGFDVAAIIEIDKEVKLCLLMDPTSTDSLVVKGEANLSFTMDKGGNMSLTGAYNLSDGVYLISLESIINKQFDINSGSTILWNGDPLDANISITAQYLVRASPYDLVANQLYGMSELDQGQYKQRYPFIVLLKLQGKILQPEISFEIQLPPEQKGILGGSVNQKLSLLNEDPSALNKQVFSLLVLGRFVQENPFQAEMGGTSTLVRSTVGKLLSAQLNQLSSRIVPGVDLNFDIQSYDDYQTGKAQGRTQVEIGLKKQLFNERISIELGGTVDVEGDKAKQNSASDITSDVTVEYKLNKEGSFRMKGFRHNQYEGAIEGQLVETGVGVVYVKDFNHWRRFFGIKRKKKDAQ